MDVEPLDVEEMAALRANLADMTRPLDGWAHVAERLLATIDEEVRALKAFKALPDDDSEPRD